MRRKHLTLAAVATAAVIIPVGAIAAGGDPPRYEPGPTSAAAPAERSPMGTGAVIHHSAEDVQRLREERRAALPAEHPRGDFSVLNRSRYAGDDLPARYAPRGPLAAGEVDEAGSRRALHGAAGVVFAIPTDRELCVATTYLRGRDAGATNTCVPTARARRTGAITITQCSDPSHPQRRYVAGLVPDGVVAVDLRRDGSAVRRVDVNANALSVEIDEPIDEVAFVGRAGGFPLPAVSC